MKEKIRVFEVRKTIIREDIEKERIIFEWDEDSKEWVYTAPNAQKHTEKQVEIILQKLKELNKNIN